MKIHLDSSPIHSISADWLIVPIFEDGLSAPAKLLDEKLDGKFSRLLEHEDMSGKSGSMVSFFHLPHVSAQRVLFIGMGKQEQLSRRKIFIAGATAAKKISSKRRPRWAAVLPDGEKIPTDDMLLAFAAGLSSGSHGPALKKKEPARFTPEHVTLLFPDGTDLEELKGAAERAEAEARAVRLARDLVNGPPSDIYPESFAQEATKYSQDLNIECEIWDVQKLNEENMQCLLAVARGSERPPCMAVMRYKNGGDKPTLALVGKGVTFDSGGLSLKTNEGMADMKCDMAGAATVLAAVIGIAELKLPVNVLGLMPLVENMPAGNAMKLGDVLTARNGTTVEVLNTDAEGRLILADALAYAVDSKVNHIVDLATLTGACLVALGTETTGLLTNNEDWASKVKSASEDVGERVWQLPMFEDFADQLKSTIADCKNVGTRYGGTITAAKFLEKFVGETPWVHLDIAGPSFASDGNAHREAGATGCMVRTLIELAAGYGG